MLRNPRIKVTFYNRGLEGVRRLLVAVFTKPPPVRVSSKPYATRISQMRLIGGRWVSGIEVSTVDPVDPCRFTGTVSFRQTGGHFGNDACVIA
jgi:hypothetical protein